jgi:hypothetical protein
VPGSFFFQHRRYTEGMRTFPGLVTAAALALAGCGDNSKTSSAPQTTRGNTSSPLDAPADYLGAIDKAQKTAIKTADVASLNQAIQLFNTDNGRNPKDLNELVEKKYIPKLPAAPYGMKIEYDATSGTVKVVKQ